MPQGSCCPTLPYDLMQSLECLFIIATNRCIHRFCKYYSFHIRSLERFHALYEMIFHDLLSQTNYSISPKYYLAFLGSDVVWTLSVESVGPGIV